MGIGFSKPKIYEAGDAVFVNSHGINDITSVVILERDTAGAPVNVIESGRVLVHIPPDRGYLPVRVSSVKTSVSSKKEIELLDASDFSVGSVVMVQGSAGGYRVITKKEGNKLTLDSNVNSEVGALVISDRGYLARLVKEKVSSNTTVKLDNVRPFKAGDDVSIGSDSFKVQSIDQSLNTITVDKNVTAEIGAPVVSMAPLKYKISIRTVHTKGEGGITPVRDYGRVRVSALKGFYRDLIKDFKNIEFDNCL